MAPSSTLKQKALALCGFSALATLLYWPVIFTNNLLIGNWTIYDQYPRLAFLARAIATGSSTLWSGNYLSGFPIHLGVWGENIDPLSRIIFAYIQPFLASHLIMLANAALGSFFLYVFCRNIGISKTGSFLAGIVYMGNEWNLSYSQMLFFSNIYPLLPILFLSVIKIWKHKYWYILLCALAVGRAWTMVLPDVVLYISFALFFFALFLDFQTWTYATAWSQRFRTTLIFLVAFSFGATFALPKIIPTLAFVAQTSRADGVLEAQGFLASAESHGYIGPNSIISMFYPYLDIPYRNYIPFFNGADALTFLYIGIVPLYLLAAYALSIHKVWKTDPFMRYFSVLFLVTLLMMVKYVPLFYLVHKLPIFKMFGGTGKYAFLTFFALPILIGQSLDSFDTSSFSKWFKKFCTLAKVCTYAVCGLALTATTAVLVWRDSLLSIVNRYFETHLYHTTTGRPLEHYYSLIEKTFDTTSHSIILTNPHLLVSILFLVLGVLLFSRFEKASITLLTFKRSAITLTLLNFIFIWQGYFTTVSATTLTDIPDALQYIQKQESISQFSQYRTFRFWAGLGEYVDLGLDDHNLDDTTRLYVATLFPNYSLTQNIDYTGGHENLMTMRMSRLMAYIGSDKAPKNELWINDSKMSLKDKTQRFTSDTNRRLLGMLNTKYVLTSFDFPSPWVKATTTTVTSAQIPLYVYTNPDVLPRVYFAHTTTRVMPDDTATFKALITQKNFKTNTLIECPTVECLASETTAHWDDTLTVMSLRDGYVSLVTHTRSPRWLVIAQSNLLGWEVTIQSNTGSYATDIFPANYVQQAILVPAGDATTTLRYPEIIEQTKIGLVDLVQRIADGL